MLTHRISLATGILLASSICPVLAHAQAAGTAQSGSSLTEAARKAREQEKNRPPAKVYTNEDIANLKGSVSVVGAPTPTAPPEGTAPAAPAAAAKAAAKPEVKDEAYWRAKFADARRKLADDTKEADILQREYNLKEQQFYSNPNVALREQYSRADLNKTSGEINAKKADVEKDKQAISTLEDQLRESGGDSGWAREPDPAPASAPASSSSSGPGV
jgi:hypothetical protein